MKPLFVANWKMFKLQSEAVAFCKRFVERCPLPQDGASQDAEPDVGIAPPYTAISAVRDTLSDTRGIMVGAQNIHWLDTGAHTGEISAKMLSEIGVQFAIIGHSERRQFYGETSQMVAKRTLAALANSIRPIVCVGESEQQYKSGQTKEVVCSQLKESLSGITNEAAKRVIIAYEPVWAIGTGLAATPEGAQEVHAVIRGLLSEMFGAGISKALPILYGGSTKPNNVGALVSKPDINGALVGGASLEPDDFADLVQCGRGQGSNRSRG